MGSTDEAFCLKWNDFSESLSSSLGSQLHCKDLQDVTLQCGTQALQCHRLVLATCSEWFSGVFRALSAGPQAVKHPVVVMWDASARDMALLLDFMYNGVVNVKQENLNTFLALAERLSVRGLTQAQAESTQSRSNTSTTRTTKVVSGPGPVAINSGAKSSQSSSQAEASGSSSGAEARLQVTEAQDIEEVAVVKQEQGHYLETTGEENYEENYDANYYDDPGMMEYDSSQNIINSKVPRPSSLVPSAMALLPTSIHFMKQRQSNESSFRTDGRLLNKPGFCDICGKNYRNISIHFEDKHAQNKNPIPCPLCGKSFSSTNSLRVHKSTYHREFKQDMK